MALEPRIYQQSLDEALLVLITITSADGERVSRFVNNNESVESNGNTFLAYPFTITLPSDTEEVSYAQLTIDNVDRQITEFIRELLEPPTFKLEVVFSGSPDVVERSIDYLRLSTVDYDALSVTGTLVPLDKLSVRAVDATYNGVEFPDIFYS